MHVSTFSRRTRSLGAGSIALSVGLGLLTGGLGTPQPVSAARKAPIVAAPALPDTTGSATSADVDTGDIDTGESSNGLDTGESSNGEIDTNEVGDGEIGAEKQAAGDLVVTEAARHKGAPYRYGAVGPNRFDCSGFTMYVYRKTADRKLPHKADLQQRYGKPVNKAAARPGDLIIIRRGSHGIHAGIYAGDGTMWSAPRTGKTVTRQKIWSSNYVVRRLV
ncbi:C40 family peptidase [Actinoplanes sp. NPDC026670]|uniref:C40 family peptidase n=1 Tax=Actinoplanes sp. NPDC026670 TaxID=3154700 RepID=UPI0033CFA8D7